MYISIAKVHSLFLRRFSNLSSFRPDLPRVWKSPTHPAHQIAVPHLPLLWHRQSLQRLLSESCSVWHWRPSQRGPHLPFSSSCLSFPQSLLGINLGFRATLSRNPLPWEKPEEDLQGSGYSVPLVPFYQPNFLGQHSHRPSRSWPHSFLTHT